MNKLIILTKRLGSYWKKDKLLSIVLILANLVCFFSFFILYAQFMPHLMVNAADNGSFRGFTFDLSAPSTRYDLLESLINEYAMESFQVQGNLNIDNENIYYSVDVVENTRADYTPNLAQKSLRNNEILTNGSELVKVTKQDPYLEIAEDKLKVIGTTYDADIVFSRDFLLKKSLPFNRVSFWTKEVLSSEEIDKVQELFANNFELESGMTGEDVLSRYMESSPIFLAIMIGFYLFSMIAFYYVLAFMLDKQGYNLWLSRVLGLSAKASIGFSVAEHLIFNLLIFAIASFVHYMLWNQIFRKITPSGSSRFQFYDYALIFVIVIVFSLLVFVPKYIKIAKTPLATSEGRYSDEL